MQNYGNFLNFWRNKRKLYAKLGEADGKFSAYFKTESIDLTTLSMKLLLELFTQYKSPEWDALFECQIGL